MAQTFSGPAFERARRMKKILAEVAHYTSAIHDDPEVVAIEAITTAMLQLDDTERARVSAWFGERW